ncbi:MAG: hypothetical protein H0T42_32145 [Deltaproteobacteria bacterium]|nr:hypothetical protein [Deltaproteobacteria bacterium]
MSDEHEIEAAITAYRAQLEAAAEIGRSDLAEIEDHLRELVRELRETGMPVGAAVVEAAHRLGEPAALAREHARVRSAFGAKLSRARAWSATALVVIQIGLALALFNGPEIPVFFVTTLVLPAIVVIGLAARLTWARALIVGMSSYALLEHVIYLVLLRNEVWGENPWVTAAFMVISLGTFAFVAPWRRGEITQAGAALVVLFAAFSAASSSFGFGYTGSLDVMLLPYAALSATIISGCGIVLRARWAAISAGAASVFLLGCWLQLADSLFDYDSSWAIRGALLGTLGLGVIAAAGTAVLSWRTARTKLGTLRSVLS